jgi:hypothetical protein
LVEISALAHRPEIRVIAYGILIDLLGHPQFGDLLLQCLAVPHFVVLATKTWMFVVNLTRRQFLRHEQLICLVLGICS